MNTTPAPAREASGRDAAAWTGRVTLIAAQAIAGKLILVTNNEREFRRVSGLKVENWTR